MVKDAAYIIEEITTILEGTYFVITKKYKILYINSIISHFILSILSPYYITRINVVYFYNFQTYFGKMHI